MNKTYTTSLYWQVGRDSNSVLELGKFHLSGIQASEQFRNRLYSIAQPLIKDEINSGKINPAISIDRKGRITGGTGIFLEAQLDNNGFPSKITDLLSFQY